MQKIIGFNFFLVDISTPRTEYLRLYIETTTRVASARVTELSPGLRPYGKDLIIPNLSNYDLQPYPSLRLVLSNGKRPHVDVF